MICSKIYKICEVQCVYINTTTGNEIWRLILAENDGKTSETYYIPRIKHDYANEEDAREALILDLRRNFGSNIEISYWVINFIEEESKNFTIKNTTRNVE